MKERTYYVSVVGKVCITLQPSFRKTKPPLVYEVIGINNKGGFLCREIKSSM